MVISEILPVEMVEKTSDSIFEKDFLNDHTNFNCWLNETIIRKTERTTACTRASRAYVEIRDTGGVSFVYVPQNGSMKHVIACFIYNGKMHVGVATRHRRDNWDPDVGKKIAMMRAMDSADAWMCPSCRVLLPQFKEYVRANEEKSQGVR